MFKHILIPTDGSELARRIREAETYTRILFTSGYTEDAMARESLLYPGAAFLEKPFTPQGLLDKTREILDAAPAVVAAR